MNRVETLALLRQHGEISVLVVGAGINGIGVFRDLALNGVDVLLIDKGDFCSGASAASSHMAHGGIRYLENGEFRLVREAVQERNRMIQNAPHLVRPLPTTIPIFRIFSGLLNAPLKFFNLLDRPRERGAVVIKLGLMLYDAYAEKNRVTPRHRFLGREESLRRWKRLNPDIRFTATYYDGAILDPERMAVEILLDAEAENPNARALNYVSLIGGQGKRVTLRDELTGETFDVTPRLLINAAGPWIDFANRALGISTRFIGGTKGSHLILNHPELREAIGDHEFFFENDDGRIVLVFPLFDKVLIGTSDIPIENPDDARCDDEEIEYFLSMLRRVFPEIRVTREHIVFRFSGVRPLEYEPNTRAAGQISRDHSLRVVNGVWTGLDLPVYSLVGGKWTSYRAFAEEVTDKALSFLGKTRRKNTRALPIGGGRNYPQSEEARRRFVERVCAWTNLPETRVRVLFERYGTLAENIAMFISQGRDEPLRTLPEYSKRELAYIAQKEKVVHLDDFLLRRSLLAMLGRLTRDNVEEIAWVLGEALNWTSERREEEVERTREILKDRHGVVLS